MLTAQQVSGILAAPDATAVTQYSNRLAGILVVFSRGEFQPMINVSETAASKISELLVEEQKSDGGLRVFVQGGGCSGFQYGFAFDETVNADDSVFSQTVDESGSDGPISHTVQLLIDPMSFQYLSGAEIDYKEDIEGAQFIIRNPNAKTTCGCGSSFSAD